MKVLIIGSHGKVGQRIVDYLKRRSDIQISCMIRDKGQENEFQGDNITTVIGDLEGEFGHAFDDVDTVIFTAGSGSKTGPDKTITVDQEGAIKSIDLAIKHGVGHYIMISAQGARSPESPSPIQHYFKAKKVADDYLSSSGLNYTILRPGRLTDDPGSGKIKLSAYIPKKGQTSRDNLAQLTSDILLNEDFYVKTLEVFDGNQLIKEAIASFK